MSNAPEHCPPEAEAYNWLPTATGHYGAAHDRNTGNLGDPIWPAGPDYEAPQNAHLYGHGHFNGLEVAPTHGLEPVVGWKGEGQVSDVRVPTVEETEKKRRPRREKRFCGKRVWWSWLVVALVIIAGLVAGIVVFATKKKTLTLPPSPTITGQPIKTNLFYVKNIAAVPGQDLVWHDAYTPSNIPGINCTLKSGAIRQQWYWEWAENFHPAERWRASNELKTQLFFIHERYNTIPPRKERRLRAIPSDGSIRDSVAEIDEFSFWFWLVEDPLVPGNYEIKNAEFGSNYSVTMQRVELGYGGRSVPGYKLRMEFAELVPSSEKTWQLEKVTDVEEPKTPDGNMWP